MLVRADVDIPRFPDCDISVNDQRLRSFIPTLKYLIKQGARVAICGHLSRPYGRVIPELSLRPVAQHLEKLSGETINFCIDCVGRAAQTAIRQLKPGEVVMLENLRFHLGESANEHDFAKELAGLADVYVMDAFATCHRNHASIATAPRIAPQCVAGISLAHEVGMLNKVTTEPERPLSVMLGGLKVSTIVGIMQDLLPQTDTIMLGGALANTFLAAQGCNMGASVFEPGQLDQARELMVEAGVVGCRLVLPHDVVVQNESDRDAAAQIKAVDALGNDDAVMDIGPETLKNWEKALSGAKTVVWSGPLGHTEEEQFQKGTRQMAAFVSGMDAYRVAGGGETVELIYQMKLGEKFDAISTGGNALLSYLEGKHMPGLMALKQSSYPAPNVDINAA